MGTVWESGCWSTSTWVDGIWAEAVAKITGKVYLMINLGGGMVYLKEVSS